MMTNIEKYLFEDFTLKNYQKIIKVAKSQNFVFVKFDSLFSENEKTIIWRHDVEFSPDIALEMANIEKDEGIVSTYFFQLHSEFIMF